MKTKTFLIAALLTAGLSAQAQSEQMVTAKTETMEVAYKLSASPKLEIAADKLIYTNGTNIVTFSSTERVVLFFKKNDTTTGGQGSGQSCTPGDVNGDTQVTISDVTKLVDILLKKKD